uniref:C2H2-type domain-containing protein n=1 Tax=Panagrellus redivivus TaxID=6233 RepID=A0A7E4ZXT7_PANRE
MEEDPVINNRESILRRFRKRRSNGESFHVDPHDIPENVQESFLPGGDKVIRHFTREGMITRYDTFEALLSHVSSDHKKFGGSYICDCNNQGYSNKANWKRHVIATHYDSQTDQVRPPNVSDAVFSLPRAWLNLPSSDVEMETESTDDADTGEDRGCLEGHTVSVMDSINLLLTLSASIPDLSSVTVDDILHPFQSTSSRERFLISRTKYAPLEKHRVFRDIIPVRDKQGAGGFIEKDRFFYATQLEYVIETMMNHRDVQVLDGYTQNGSLQG